MKYETKDGEKILVFDDCEEMKWYFHKKMCKGEMLQSEAMFLIEHCLTVDKANQYFKNTGKPCRVKKKGEP